MPPSIARCRPPLQSLLQFGPPYRFNFLRQVSTATSILPDDIYDVVVVGGGIAGLALASGLCFQITLMRLIDSIFHHD